MQACAGTLLKIPLACHVHLPHRLMRCSPQLLAAAELSFGRPRLCAATGQMKVWLAHHEPNYMSPYFILRFFSDYQFHRI